MELNNLMFPNLCVDDFYENPDDIRNWALSLPYDSLDNFKGIYPGKQTRYLHEISPVFFDIFCRKLFSLFFDTHTTELEWNITTAFSLIDPYTDPELNIGWVHTDDIALFGGIIYLDPDPNPETGTSVGYLKSEDFDFQESQDIRKPFYTGTLPEEKINDYKNALKKNNDAFVETVRFSNVYNRFICFDGKTHHKANNFGSDRSRLTQVFFVNALNSSSAPPIERMKNFNPPIL